MELAILRELSYLNIFHSALASPGQRFFHKDHQWDPERNACLERLCRHCAQFWAVDGVALNDKRNGIFLIEEDREPIAVEGHALVLCLGKRAVLPPITAGRSIWILAPMPEWYATQKLQAPLVRVITHAPHAVANHMPGVFDRTFVAAQPSTDLLLSSHASHPISTWLAIAWTLLLAPLTEPWIPHPLSFWLLALSVYVIGMHALRRQPPPARFNVTLILWAAGITMLLMANALLQLDDPVRFDPWAFVPLFWVITCSLAALQRAWQSCELVWWHVLLVFCGSINVMLLFAHSSEGIGSLICLCFVLLVK